MISSLLVRGTARLLLVVAPVLVAVCQSPAWGQLTPYFQDFEALDLADPFALANDGWRVFGNVFDNPRTTTNPIYGYGPFAAPQTNALAGISPAFSLLGIAAGGPPAGAQQLVAISDYQNADHNTGLLIESNVYQERVITSADVGQVATFSFLASPDNLQAPSTAQAFIKTVEPGNSVLGSFSQLSNLVTVDTSSLPGLNTPLSLSLAIDSSLVGHAFQFGFLNTAESFNPSGVGYDNVELTVAPIPEPGSLQLVLMGLALLSAGLIVRR